MPIRSPIAVQTPNTCHSTNCLILFIKLKLHYFNLNSQHIFCNFANGRKKVGGVENFQSLQKVFEVFEVYEVGSIFHKLKSSQKKS